MSDPVFFSTHDAARIMRVSPSAVLSWVDQGLIRAHKTPGGHRRIEKGDLIEFVREREMPVPAALSRIGRLLVIDDDAPFLRNARRALRRHAPEMAVDTARGTIEGLLRVGVFRPEAVLVDAYMQGLDGVEFCRALASLPETSDVMLVAISGKPSKRLKKRFMEAGAVAFMTKPLDVPALMRHLGRSEALAV